MERSGIALVDELHTAYLGGGVSEPHAARMERMYGVIAQRKDEITMTLMLMLSDTDPLHDVLNNALLGLRYSKDSERPEFIAKPLFATIELQSLRKSCPKCKAHTADKKAPPCPRQNQYHDVTYRVGAKSGTAGELRNIVRYGGSTEEFEVCAVDPETGRFSLSPIEAKKALREWGENVIKLRHRHPGVYDPKTDRVVRSPANGDRWKIREVRHYDLYATAALAASVSNDAPTMSAAD